MKVPPYLVAMRVVEQGRTKVRLWLPLFLLWPLALPLIVLTLLGTVIVDVCRLLDSRKWAYTRLAVGVLGLLGETRGTEIFVQDGIHTVAFRLR
jgi:hypothetical protein